MGVRSDKRGSTVHVARSTLPKGGGHCLSECEGKRRDLTPTVLLCPLQAVLETQRFIASEAANCAGYIVSGMFMWARGVSPFQLLEESDPVHAWRARLLAMFDGLAARAVGFGV